MSHNSISVTRFDVQRNSYSFEDTFLASLNRSSDWWIGDHLDGLCSQTARFAGEPTGWSFARWKRGNNASSNLIENNAVVLEYPIDALTALEPKLLAMGWQHFFITTENRAGTRNTITVVIPFSEAVDTAYYARIASVLATQLDEYQMEDGCLAPTHVVHVHRSSKAAVVAGAILDPSAFIKETKDYPAKSARKYERPRPMSAAVVHLEAPVFTQSDDGLFAFPETEIEKAHRVTREILARAGVPLV